MMIGQITDSFLGHIQIHKKGYVASLDSLPLTLNLGGKSLGKVEKAISETPEIEAYSKRIKFGAMFSNFVETTNVRLNGVYPEDEFKTAPLFLSRIREGEKTIKPGEILVPELLAKGMKVKVGDTVVVIATNRDGSVNGKQFQVGGILESVTGPGGRDGYIHIEDAAEILRMDSIEIGEIAVRLRNFDKIHSVFDRLRDKLASELNKQGKPAFEVHTWEKLSPFYNLYKADAYSHCTCKYNECYGYGSVRTNKRNRHYCRHRYTTRENSGNVSDRGFVLRAIWCSSWRCSGSSNYLHTKRCQTNL